MDLMIARLVNSILEAIPKRDIHSFEDVLRRGFVFCFDKAVENMYNLRARPTANLTYNFNDMYEENSEENVPEYIQLKVTPIIPQIVLIFNKVIDEVYTHSKEYLDNDISIEELIKCMLYGGMKLGTEFCLRIDLTNTDELDALLKE